MQFEELRYVCQEAALDLVKSVGRPLPPTVVLPGPQKTRLLRLPDFPADDEQRHDLIAQLAQDEVSAKSVPCWGFVAEAEIGGTDAVVVVFGARRHMPHVTAAALDSDGVPVEFEPSEELDPTAMPFLHPLQHAVDSLPAEQPPDDDEGFGGGLPIVSPN